MVATVHAGHHDAAWLPVRQRRCDKVLSWLRMDPTVLHASRAGQHLHMHTHLLLAQTGAAVLAAAEFAALAFVPAALQHTPSSSLALAAASNSNMRMRCMQNSMLHLL